MSKQDNAKSYLKKRKHPFVQVPSAIFQATQNKSAICLYLSLMTYADSDGFCFPSYSKIKEQTGMSNTTISKALDELKKIGLVTIEKQRRHGNVQENNTYYIEFDIGKPSSPENGHGKFSSPENGVGSSPENGHSLVQKMDSNYNQDNNNQDELERGAKAPSSQIALSELLPKVDNSLEGRKKKFIDDVNACDKYSKDLKEKFIAHYTQVDDSAKNKVMLWEARRKKNNNIFSIAGTLATWKKNEKPSFTKKEDKETIIRNATMHMSFEDRIQWQVDNGYIDKEIMKGWD